MERTPLIAAAEKNDAPALLRLLASGQDADTPGPGGLTALMRAAARGATDALTTLLAHGAQVDAVDAFGNTALMYACARGQAASVRLLLAAGAAPTHVNKYAQGPEQWRKWASAESDIDGALRTNAPSPTAGA